MLLSGTSSKQTRWIDWDLALTDEPFVAKSPGYWIGTHFGASCRQQLLPSGISSKLDKSVLIGTSPNEPAVCEIKRILDWDLCTAAAMQATAAVIGDQQQSTSQL
jgi:hypothetical protein